MLRLTVIRRCLLQFLSEPLGFGTNAEILDIFGEEPKLLATMEKDTSTNYQEGILELYKKLRPGEPLSVESAEALISGMFFDPRRYDLAHVGRYKFNKKLSFKSRLTGQVLAEDVVDEMELLLQQQVRSLQESQHRLFRMQLFLQYLLL